jgi:biopolymer transport protein TolQ
VLSPSLPLLAFINPVKIFAECDPIGQGVVVLLFIYSIWVWSKMAQKWSALRRARNDTRRFLFLFTPQSHPLKVFLGHDKFHDSPLYKVYEAGCRRLMEEVSPNGLQNDSLFRAGGQVFNRRISSTQTEIVKQNIERATLEQALSTQDGMSVLATATSLAPFLGLLGTVWGVMVTFYGMGEAKGALTLAEVAPGVSAALLGTIMGLIVAIPSSFGYNHLSGLIRELMVQLDNFAGEFAMELKRHYGPEDRD